MALAMPRSSPAGQGGAGTEACGAIGAAGGGWGAAVHAAAVTIDNASASLRAMRTLCDRSRQILHPRRALLETETTEAGSARRPARRRVLRAAGPLSQGRARRSHTRRRTACRPRQEYPSRRDDGVESAGPDRKAGGRLEHGPVRTQERQPPVVVSNQIESPFADGPMMAPAQQHQLVEAGRTAVHPAIHVMRVAAAGRAAREPATLVTRLECPPDRGRHGPRLAPDVEERAVGAVMHRHHRCVTGQAPGFLRGDVDRTVVDLQRPARPSPAATPSASPGAAPRDIGRQPTHGPGLWSAPPPPVDRAHRPDAVLASPLHPCRTCAPPMD